MKGNDPESMPSPNIGGPLNCGGSNSSCGRAGSYRSFEGNNKLTAKQFLVKRKSIRSKKSFLSTNVGSAPFDANNGQDDDSDVHSGSFLAVDLQGDSISETVFTNEVVQNDKMYKGQNTPFKVDIRSDEDMLSSNTVPA